MLVSMLRAIDRSAPSADCACAIVRAIGHATIGGSRCAIGGAGDGIALSGGQLPAPVVPGVIALPQLAYLTAIGYAVQSSNTQQLHVSTHLKNF